MELGHTGTDPRLSWMLDDQARSSSSSRSERTMLLPDTFEDERASTRPTIVCPPGLRKRWKSIACCSCLLVAYLLIGLAVHGLTNAVLYAGAYMHLRAPPVPARPPYATQVCLCACEWAGA